MTKQGPILLVDADVLRYQLAFSNTAKIDWGDGVVSEATNPERAKVKLDDYIEELVDKFGARDYLLALSGKENFRTELFPDYKLNRNHAERPKLWSVLDEFVYDAYASKIVEIPRLEGDDVLGLLATHPNPKRAPGPRILVSIDKDMQTLPGIRLYNPNKPDVGVRPISQHDADLFWMKQVITGDQVDNYPGFPGIGHKGADELLQPIHEALLDASPEEHLAALWDKVVETYTTRIPRGGSKPLTQHDALVQARLARILRHGDYSPKSREVHLWKPPCSPSSSSSPRTR